MNYSLNDKILIPPISDSSSDFEECYTSVRNLEQRVYPDEVVMQLPEISAQHVHSKEWINRKKSSGRLIQYLKEKNRPLNILEVGCGNGWLSNQLSKISGSKVTGIDINRSELQQAQRIFGNRSNVEFIYGDIAEIGSSKFDIIVFAASIQYFSSLRGILDTALQLLLKDGEIHILDSVFYQRDEVPSARERTRAYYQKLGFVKMTNHYFHHSLDELKEFNPKIFYDPRSLKNKFFNNSPLYWVCIKNLSQASHKRYR